MAYHTHPGVESEPETEPGAACRRLSSSVMLVQLINDCLSSNQPDTNRNCLQAAKLAKNIK